MTKLIDEAVIHRLLNHDPQDFKRKETMNQTKQHIDNIDNLAIALAKAKLEADVFIVLQIGPFSTQVWPYWECDMNPEELRVQAAVFAARTIDEIGNCEDTVTATVIDLRKTELL